MKRLLKVLIASALTFTPLTALSDSASDMMHICGFSGFCATHLQSGGLDLNNASYLQGIETDGDVVNIIGLDSSNDVRIIAGGSSGDEVIIAIGSGGGTAEVKFTNDTQTFTGTTASIVGGGTLRLRPDGDANRLLDFSASSDVLITQKFGDAGTTAVQFFTISASTADADDDSSLVLAGGGASGGTRGSTLTLQGEEVSGGGDAILNTGTSDSVFFQAAGSLHTTLESDGDLLMTGDIYAADGADFGLTVSNGANTACDTTCTTGCLIGYDAGTSAFVACASALADSCACTK